MAAPVKAIKPSTDVVCEDCNSTIKPGARVSCFVCATDDIESAERAARADERRGHKSAAQAIREWAARRHLMGQLSREVRAELELCADDIECGHG